MGYMLLRMNLENMISTCWKILLTCETQNKQIHRYRKEITGCQESGSYSHGEKVAVGLGTYLGVMGLFQK